MLDFILLIAGLFGLWVGTEILITGATGYAQVFKLSDFFVGMTILAFGTDIPELIVGVSSSFKALNGTPTSDLVIGSALGSAITQISLALGVTAFFGYLTIPKRVFYRDGTALALSLILLVALTWDGVMTRIEALFYLTAYLIYLVILFRGEKNTGTTQQPLNPNTLLFSLYILGGSAVLYLTSELVVQKCLLLSEKWGVSQSFLGVTLISIGTSLPEISISLNALRKGVARLSVGNIIGSNLFDTLFVIGVCSVISPLQFDRSFAYLEIPALMFLTSMALLFLSRFKRGLQRPEAIVLIVGYFLFLSLKFYTSFSSLLI